MAAELPQPGVEVIQVFRSVSPSIITPTLLPNIVGVAKQVVELLVDDGAGGQQLNPAALIQLPGFFVALAASGGPPAVYGGLDGLALALKLNNGPEVTVLFEDATASGLTPATVVGQINAAFALAGVTVALAELVGDGTTQWQLRTIGTGPFQTIYVTANTDPAVAAAFGIGLGQTYSGLSAYNQYEVEIPQSNFPDPRGNLAELGIELDSIRVFQALGSGQGVRESLRDTAFLRNGVVDDAAVFTGSVDLTTLTLPGDIGTNDLILAIDGGADQSFNFASPANPAAIVSQILAAITGVTVTLNLSNQLVITSLTTGASSSVEVVGGAAAATLGLAVSTVTGDSIEALDDGDGDAFTSLIEFFGEDFTAAPTAAVLTASAAALNPPDGETLVLSDGQQPQTVIFDSVASITDIIAQINAVVGPAAGGRITASDAGGGVLRLTHSLSGTDSYIEIIGGTSLANLDPGGTPTFVVGTYYATALSLPEAGDEIWIDGQFYANVSEVAPGGDVDVIKIDRLVAIAPDVGATFYILGKNLDTALDPTRPAPDLVITLGGAALLKQEQLRDTQGNPVDTTAPIYLSYTAVRRDVTALANQPGLLIFDDTIQLDEALSPINTSNPLGLGLFFALINGPGVQVSGLGVDEISADSPFGTVDGFARAAEYLEGQEIYATVPLTHSVEVHQLWKAHAEGMSEPEAKGERVALVNQPIPTNKLDTLVASGTNGNATGAGTSLDTSVANLTALVLNAGISPVGTIPASAGLFLDIASDALRYSIESIAGSVITIRTTFAPGENEDDFYSTTPLDTPIIQESFSIKVRGAPLVTVTGAPDNQAIAETISAIGQSYGSRRLWMTFPDQCAATIDGLEQLIEGFYMTAGIAGMIGAQPPSQSFTNFPMTGYTRVIGSNDRFNQRQLNIMAGGGAYIIIQDAQGSPLTARFALTTDLTSVETRTDSITKVVDFTAKFMRRSLRNYIGRFNITQAFLDSLGTVISGLGGFLVETGTLVGFNLNNIIQDEDQPDAIIVDVTLDVPFPANFIRLTLVI